MRIKAMTMFFLKKHLKAQILGVINKERTKKEDSSLLKILIIDDNGCQQKTNKAYT